MDIKDRKDDGYLFRAELHLDKASMDGILRRVREAERRELKDYFTLDVDIDTLQ